MKVKLSNFCRFSVALMVFLCASSVMAEQAPNPRSAVNVNSVSRVGARVVTRGDGENTGVVNRTGVEDARFGRESVVARSGHKNTVARSAKASVTTKRSADAVARSASKTHVSRSATVAPKSNARAATPIKSGVARAASLARATAVFSDVSKIGGGYAQCREAYATCMDQFCANANDTYRRCYCSQRFTDFRQTEVALDEVQTLLQRFEDNNLSAVDKTAAEVNAMYTATIGEGAIKNDVSGAQSILNEAADILSGKKKAAVDKKESALDSIDGLYDSFGDIWGASSPAIFDNGNQRTSVTELEGQALYNETNKQCVELVKDVCSSEAVLNMATSSYSIMISQDCNIYERKIDAQREAVMNTVRQAEKILRQARLEEYRAHNSADVNQCLSKVRDAMLEDTACGEKYKRCLDYTGNYINSSTGEPIYSPILFKLTDLIDLYGNDGTNADVVKLNVNYSRWLDDRRMFAETALDSCRDIADTVWNEFKRAAIIEIAQAQEAKLEEVRSSCVSTITECYDNQSSQLKDMDEKTSNVVGAMGVRVASVMCEEKVMACAALYSKDATKCNYDKETRKFKNADGCGLSALMDYVKLVNSAKITEECVAAMDVYLKNLCTPTSGDITEYPYKCRLTSIDELKQSLGRFVRDNCDMTADEFAKLTDNDKIKRDFDKKIAEIEEGLDVLLSDECVARDGYWIKDATDETKLKKFYSDIFGGKEDDSDIGYCVENTTRVRCLNHNEFGKAAVASYDLTKDECVFTDEWFARQCEAIGGYYEDSFCYVPKSSN